MHTPRATRPTLTFILGLSLAACGSGSGPATEDDPAAAFARALPTRTDALVAFPGAEVATQKQHLTAADVGQSASGLLGEPSEYYTTSYYQARRLNGFAARVLHVLEAITHLPPTLSSARSATWGPLSDPGEPNQWVLSVERRVGPPEVYVWVIQGKPRSSSVASLETVAAGAFEPAGGNDGRGWFQVDFETLRRLDPTEASRGQIQYQFARAPEGVVVQAFARMPDASGTPREAGYSFGHAATGEGYMLFAYEDDVHPEERPTPTAREHLVLRTRWTAAGVGRSEAMATAGDLGAHVVVVSQCWDQDFVTTHEAMYVDANLQAARGDETTCALPLVDPPAPEELPTEADTESPVGP